LHPPILVLFPVFVLSSKFRARVQEREREREREKGARKCEKDYNGKITDVDTHSILVKLSVQRHWD